MSTNVEKIMSSLGQIHEIWASVPEIGVAIWLLASQMSYASVLPLVICLGKPVSFYPLTQFKLSTGSPIGSCTELLMK